MMSKRMSLSGAAIKALVVFGIAGYAAMACAAPADIAEQWNPPTLERLKLPKYCWAQFDAAYAKQSGTKMPTQICGVTMNHFCPALVMLNRAQDSKYSPNTRQDIMREAFGGLNYTQKNMPPNCPLKPDLEAAKSKADLVARFLPKGNR